MNYPQQCKQIYQRYRKRSFQNITEILLRLSKLFQSKLELACLCFSLLSFRIQTLSRVKKIYLVPQKQVSSAFQACIFLQLANLPTEAIFDAVLVTIRFQLTCINYQRFLDDLLPEITGDWRFR